MSNLEKFNSAFIRSLLVEESQLPDLKYQETPNWDSVGHMTLITAIEEEFGIAIEIDDIIELFSYSKGIEILREKYNVNL